MASDKERLRKIPVFASLSEANLQDVARAAILRAFLPGELIILEGDSSEAAYFISCGHVQIFRMSPGGREQVLVNLGPGEAFNTVPLFEPGSLNPASARALGQVEIFVFLRDDFLRLMHTSPDLAMAVLKDFADKLTYLTTLVEQLSLHSIRGRMARFLIEQADQGQVARNWTQDEIAKQLGTVRDVVGRTLKAFTEAGYIRRSRNRIILLDRSGLENEAQQ
jgi:CRP/FNR family cyclic AMP-dependent transcriptional regulator